MSEIDDLLLREQRGAIEALEKLIEDVRAGRITEFFGIGVHPGGSYRMVGGACADRHTAAGMLLEMAIDRLAQDKE